MDSLVSWVCSFVTGRRQRVRYQGSLSDWLTLTCGVPQGTKLGPLVFLALVNDALPCHETSSDSFKYVDDISVAESRHVSAAPRIQADIDGLTEWTDANFMALNPTKCKVMVFCFLRNPPPPPVITIGTSQLEVVQAARILGLILQHNLKWTEHVTSIVGKVSNRLYMLRILKKHGLDTSDLILIYIGFVRPVLEYACVIWHPGLTRELSQKIERVQKRSLRVILGSEYDCYHTALDTTGLSRLDTRRDELCLRFARSLTSSEKYRNRPHSRYMILFSRERILGVTARDLARKRDRRWVTPGAAPVLHSWVKQKPERPAPKKRCSPTKKKKGACGLNKIDEPEDSSACCSDPGLDTNMAILQPDLATSPSPTALSSQTTSSPCLPDKLFTTTCTELLKLSCLLKWHCIYMCLKVTRTCTCFFTNKKNDEKQLQGSVPNLHAFWNFGYSHVCNLLIHDLVKK
ncbi:hypothetical protein Bbelb_293050 [Branchiostoma belcheri]|nr:hypothetical protein Bbelb_293050 [Branchiostoma belcheri]